MISILHVTQPGHYSYGQSEFKELIVTKPSLHLLAEHCRVALNFYLKVMAPGWLLYFFKYVLDMTSSYPKLSFPRVPLLS